MDIDSGFACKFLETRQVKELSDVRCKGILS
jgi:hypothetical protein